MGETLAERWSVSITEGETAGVTTYTVTPAELDPANTGRLFIHVHGGAYVFGRGPAGTPEAVLIAHYAGIPVVSIDYRMPPEDPFPAAVDDVVTVWRSLLTERSAKSMALGGTSAGGGLALASTLRFMELGLETPGALWAGTPWADLTKTGDSQFTNEGIDRALVSYDGLLEGAANLYADGRDLKTPLISPVYGDFAGFPPTYLVTGTRDLLLSDVVRVHRKMRVAGVVADLNVYEGVSHADYLFVMDSPEMDQVFGELGEFLLRHLR
jgi:acetyl esterase/lipase